MVSLAFGLCGICGKTTFDHSKQQNKKIAVAKIPLQIKQEIDQYYHIDCLLETIERHSNRGVKS